MEMSAHKQKQNGCLCIGQERRNYKGAQGDLRVSSHAHLWLHTGIHMSKLAKLCTLDMFHMSITPQ